MIPDQDPYYSAVKELADVECSQKMIDDLLRSIKTDTKSLTSVQSNTLPAVYRTPYVQVRCLPLCHFVREPTCSGHTS